jgi:hypothetical protein
VKSASKLPDEEIRERARSGLDGVSAHEQCIDLQRAEVPVGHCANLGAASSEGLIADLATERGLEVSAG